MVSLPFSTTPKLRAGDERHQRGGSSTRVVRHGRATGHGPPRGDLRDLTGGATKVRAKFAPPRWRIQRSSALPLGFWDRHRRTTTASQAGCCSRIAAAYQELVPTRGTSTGNVSLCRIARTKEGAGVPPFPEGRARLQLACPGLQGRLTGPPRSHGAPPWGRPHQPRRCQPSRMRPGAGLVSISAPRAGIVETCVGPTRRRLRGCGARCAGFRLGTPAVAGRGRKRPGLRPGPGRTNRRSYCSMSRRGDADVLRARADGIRAQLFWPAALRASTLAGRHGPHPDVRGQVPRDDLDRAGDLARACWLNRPAWIGGEPVLQDARRLRDELGGANEGGMDPSTFLGWHIDKRDHPNDRLQVDRCIGQPIAGLDGRMSTTARFELHDVRQAHAPVCVSFMIHLSRCPRPDPATPGTGECSTVLPQSSAEPAMD